MPAREDAISATRATEVALRHSAELASHIAQDCDDFARQLQAGGFRKAADTLFSTGGVLRVSVSAILLSARTSATNSLESIASANADDLDAAAASLAAGHTHLAEICEDVSTTLRTLDQTTASIARLGSPADRIVAMLQQTIGELSTALRNQQEATRATKEAVDSLCAAAEQSDAESGNDDEGHGGQAQRLNQTGGSSFRRPLNKIDFELDWSEHAYDQIRADPQLHSVCQTASGHGIAPVEIDQIYRHLFIDEHELDDGIMRFDPNPRMPALGNVFKMDPRTPRISTSCAMSCTNRHGCATAATATIKERIGLP